MAEQAANLVGDLTIICHEAQDLYDAQMLSKQDPYAALKIAGTTKKTKVHKNAGKDASWEEAFIYKLTGKEGLLDIQVFDKEFISDNHIGATKIPLDKLIENNTPLWYTLTRSGNHDAGRVKLTAKFKGTHAGKPMDTTVESKQAVEAKSEHKHTVAPVAPSSTPPLVFAQAPAAQPVYVQPPPQPVYAQAPPQPMYAPPSPQPMYAAPAPQPMYAPAYAPQPAYQQPYPPAQPSPIYGQYAQYQAPPPMPVNLQPQPYATYYPPAQAPQQPQGYYAPPPYPPQPR